MPSPTVRSSETFFRTISRQPSHAIAMSPTHIATRSKRSENGSVIRHAPTDVTAEDEARRDVPPGSVGLSWWTILDLNQ